MGPVRVTLALPAPITRADVPALCDRVRALLTGTAGGVVVCDMGGAGTADLDTVDTLARLCLTARRCGGTIQLRRAPEGLRELLAFVGLCTVVGSWEEADP